MKTTWKNILFCVSAIIFGIGLNVSAAEERPVLSMGDYEYSLLEDGTAEIIHYNGTDADLEVPEEMDGAVVTSIGKGAFAHCGSLRSLVLPDGITSIGEKAFSKCKSLTNLTLPDSITSIGRNPLLGCSSMEQIKVSVDNPTLAVIDGLLYFKPEKRLVYCPLDKAIVEIPRGIQSIGASAFSGCVRLSSILLPDSLLNIGKSAFENCTGLSSIILPDSVTSIGEAAFSGCESLSSITLPAGLTSLEYYAFSHCKSLVVVSLPDGLTSIGEAAFSGCESLSCITLPESLTSIGKQAFSGCESLSSITLPAGVTNIGDDALYGCEGLIITVSRDSYAAQYCEENGLNYMYTDSLDWLN